MTDTPRDTAFRILAQCAPGLEDILSLELAALGAPAGQQTRMPGGILWSGGWTSILAANLSLRVASRVLIEIGSFGARALGELTRKAARSVDWDRVHRAAGGDPSRIQFRVSASRSRLYHEGAIEARLREAAGLPPQVGGSDDVVSALAAATASADPPVLLVVRVHRDQVTVRLDTSGAHLHLRGYRQHVGAAPLRETLAAALLLQGVLSEDGTPSLAGIMDPFCGSGTIPIEAVLLARRIPPGMASPGFTPRRFGVLDWPDLPPNLWERSVAEARDRILRSDAIPARVFGSDRDPSAIDAARANAERAGVLDDLQLETANLSRAPRPEGPGWLVTNPPFGTRLGGRSSLRPLYTSLGRTLMPGGRLAGWSLLYLSADPVLDRVTGLSLETRLTTRHGGLAVRAMACCPPRSQNGSSRRLARELSGGPGPGEIVAPDGPKGIEDLP
jgi:putative N6-adenine-specific DNA methylase